MSWRQSTIIGDRKEWILKLLWAPVGPAKGERIVGRTRMMKGAFLVSRMLEEEFGENTDFEFRPHKYGPFDQKVYEAVEELEREGLLEIENRPKSRGGDTYHLTPSGRSQAQDLFNNLDEDHRQLLSWIRGRHLSKSVSSLLNFIYSRYPDMAENSEWDHA